jgi:hypothetical protein
VALNTFEEACRRAAERASELSDLSHESETRRRPERRAAESAREPGRGGGAH